MSKGVRRVARILGGISCGFFIIAFLLPLIAGEVPPKPSEWMELAPMLVMLGIVIFAYVIAYFPRKKGELAGGAILVITSICMGLYILIPKGPRVIMAALIYCLPFLIPGVFFLLSYRKDERFKQGD